MGFDGRPSISQRFLMPLGLLVATAAIAGIARLGHSDTPPAAAVSPEFGALPAIDSEKCGEPVSLNRATSCRHEHV